MKLDEVRLMNFRVYREECSIPIKNLTALVGRNDVGKSTVLDALGIFFAHELCKFEPGDRNVHAPSDEDIAITCVFSDLPPTLVLDDTASTSLADEHLLNADGKLEIRRLFRGEKMKEETVLVAMHPSRGPARDLLLSKNADLKKLAAELGVTADQRSNVDLRRAIRAAVDELELVRTEIPVAKEGAKDIWGVLQRELPLFALSSEPTAQALTRMVKCRTRCALQ